MRQIQKRVLALSMVFAMLLCTLVGGAAAEGSESSIESAEQTSLGALAACVGHTLDTFGGTPACVNENGDLHICENNFPDEKFREYIWRLSGANDGYFTAQECENIIQMDVSYMPIQSLRGVEFFTGLAGLNCSSCSLTELDCSMNTALTELSCSKNLLERLNISSNPNLRVINCSYNELTSLDVTSCTNLSVFYCYRNQLTELI